MGDEKNNQEHAEAVNTAYKEIRNEPVTSEDMRAADIIKRISDNAVLAAKVCCAYNAAKTREAIISGRETLSTNMDNMAKTTVGKMKEGSKLYDQYQEQKAQIVEKYDNGAAKVASEYDLKIQKLIQERTSLELENVDKRAEQHTIKKARKLTQKNTKETAKEMKDIMPQITAVRNRALLEMQRGNTEGYEKAMQEASELESTLKAKGLNSTKALDAQQRAFNYNKTRIEQNKKRLAEIKKEIEELEDKKQEAIKESAKEKKKELADFKAKTGLRKRISMFLSQFAINKSQKLKDNVFVPAGNWIKDNFKNAKETVTKKSTEIIQGARNNVRNTGIRAAERLNAYVQNRNAQIQQLNQRNAQRQTVEQPGQNKIGNPPLPPRQEDSERN